MSIKTTQRSRARKRAGKSVAANTRSVAISHSLRPGLQQTLDRLIAAANQALATHSGARTSPQDEGRNLYKQAVYSEVWTLFEKGRQNEIKMIVEQSMRLSLSIAFERNPYYWALYALSAPGILDFDVKLSFNNLGWQLLHAHRHRMLPSLLTGFLYQTAASSAKKQKLIKAAGSIYYEPWFSQYRVQINPVLPARLQL